MSDGFVARYDPHRNRGRLAPGEGAFLPCTFWLADNVHLLGREAEAAKLYERLLAVQRRGLDFRGIRSAKRDNCRQLPAGLHARRPGKHGAATFRLALVQRTPGPRVECVQTVNFDIASGNINLSVHRLPYWQLQRIRARPGSLFAANPCINISCVITTFFIAPKIRCNRGV